MSIRYFTPQSSLHPYIRSFAILEESASVFNKRIILPDGNPALMINFGAPLVWEAEPGRTVELPRAFFGWIQTKPLKIRATGWSQAIYLHLNAWAARFLVGEQTDLTANPIIPMGGVWRDLTHLLGMTLRQHGEMEALATLMQFASDQHARSAVDATLIRQALDGLYRTKGQSAIQELADQCAISSSQLERHSKYFTGLSPKALARLIRFDAACAGLLQNPSDRLTDLAQEFGFSDQAHFIHEFKTFAACTPKEARAYIRQLAADAEFLQFS